MYLLIAMSVKHVEWYDSGEVDPKLKFEVAKRNLVRTHDFLTFVVDICCPQTTKYVSNKTEVYNSVNQVIVDGFLLPLGLIRQMYRDAEAIKYSATYNHQVPFEFKAVIVPD